MRRRSPPGLLSASRALDQRSRPLINRYRLREATPGMASRSTARLGRFPAKRSKCTEELEQLKEKAHPIPMAGFCTPRWPILHLLHLLMMLSLRASVFLPAKMAPAGPSRPADQAEGIDTAWSAGSGAQPISATRTASCSLHAAWQISSSPSRSTPPGHGCSQSRAAPPQRGSRPSNQVGSLGKLPRGTSKLVYRRAQA